MRKINKNYNRIVFDENDGAEYPALMKWTLTDTLENIINKRQGVVSADRSNFIEREIKHG